MKTLRLTMLATLALSLAAGCDLGSDGGSNDGQQGPGSGDDGVALDQGEIAVSPRGTSFLARVGSSLIHGDVDGSWRTLERLEDPDRLAFSPTRDVIYVATNDPPRLRAHNLTEDAPLWSTKLPDDGSWTSGWADADGDGRPWIQVTEDDRFVIVTGFYDLTVYDAATGGTLGRWESEDQIVDVDLDASGDAAYVVFSETWVDGFVKTPFTTFELPGLESNTITLPNCADEAVMNAKGRYAFMAPTRCNEDPVSVIDLETGTFVRNLPGFGPVALADGGDVAVAFMNLDNLDASLFLDDDPMPEGDRQYHLMLIDTETLDFTTVELGDSLPRYVPTPDGKLLLVDADAWYDDERVRIFDLQTGELHPVLGPDVRLHDFVLTSDSQRAYLVDEGAYELSIPDRVISSLPLAVIPTNLNLTADDRWLLLQDDLGPVHVYDTEAAKVTAIVGDASAD
ncbi:MAG: hypothetical protein AAGA54_14355 [Myxococcota bacterium]